MQETKKERANASKRIDKENGIETCKMIFVDLALLKRKESNGWDMQKSKVDFEII